jgi:hypothetical protein
MLQSVIDCFWPYMVLQTKSTYNNNSIYDSNSMLGSPLGSSPCMEMAAKNLSAVPMAQARSFRKSQGPGRTETCSRGVRERTCKSSQRFITQSHCSVVQLAEEPRSCISAPWDTPCPESVKMGNRSERETRKTFLLTRRRLTKGKANRK